MNLINKLTKKQRIILIVIIISTVLLSIGIFKLTNYSRISTFVSKDINRQYPNYRDYSNRVYSSKTITKYCDKHFEKLVKTLDVQDNDAFKWIANLINETNEYHLSYISGINSIRNDAGYYFNNPNEFDSLNKEEINNDGYKRTTTVSLHGDFAIETISENYEYSGVLKWIDGVYYEDLSKVKKRTINTIYYKGQDLISVSNDNEITSKTQELFVVYKENSDLVYGGTKEKNGISHYIYKYNPNGTKSKPLCTH